MKENSNIELNRIFDRLSNLGSDRVKIYSVEKNDLKISEKESIVEDIRRIRPQSRGSVVASGGKVLPLSGSKKLNLLNTPVILVKEDSRPVYVFPCKVGERYYSVQDGFTFLEKNLPALPILQGEMEESLCAMISSNPNKLERGLRFYSFESDTPLGRADLVLQDEAGKFLVLEVEREASDSTLGQVLRLSEGVERECHLLQKSVRSGIVCYRANENTLAACKRVGVEVWVFVSDEQLFHKKV